MKGKSRWPWTLSPGPVLPPPPHPHLAAMSVHAKFQETPGNRGGNTCVIVWTVLLKPEFNYTVLGWGGCWLCPSSPGAVSWTGAKKQLQVSHRGYGRRCRWLPGFHGKPCGQGLQEPDLPVSPSWASLMHTVSVPHRLPCLHPHSWD